MTYGDAELPGQPRYGFREWVVQDANILIDLFETGLFRGCIDLLEFWILVPDVVAAEIRSQADALADAIEKSEITCVQLTPEEVVAVALRRADLPALSFEDHAAWYIAETRNCMLLTGDRKLRGEAKAAGVPVHGLLWIMRRLSERGWNRSDLFLKLETLMQRGRTRLPEDDCRSLLAELSE